MLVHKGRKLFTMHLGTDKPRVEKPYFIVDGEIIPQGKVEKVTITLS